VWQRTTLGIAGFLASMGSADALSLSSPDIAPGATIADEQAFNSSGCDGKNISPALAWSEAPKGTKSLALTVFDLDAPTGHGFWHWVVFDIPPEATSLAKGAGDPNSAAAPKGAVQRRTGFGTPGYSGPCPPQGAAPHHYQFTIYALDVEKIDASANAEPASIASRLRSHALAKATLIGVWGH